MAFDYDTAAAERDQLPEELYDIILGAAETGSHPEPGAVEPRLRPLKEIRAVVFDVYGTLFQSAAGEITVHTESDKLAPFRRFRKLLDPALPDDAVTDAAVRDLADRYYAKIAEVHAARRALGVEYPEVDIVTIWDSLAEEFPVLRSSRREERFARARRLALLYEIAANPLAPMPGAAAVLEALYAAGKRLGILSNAQFYTPLFFSPLLGKDVEEFGFSLAIWSYREGEAKPSVRLYHKAASWFSEAYGLGASQLLMIGNDMRNDVAPASEAGMRTALFAGDRRSLRLRENDPTVATVSPDLVLTDLRQLNEVLS